MERDSSRYLDDEGTLRYMRVSQYYRSLIEEKKLEAGAKLPSIRTCSIQLNLSRTTVETAYLMLAAEGYIGGKAAERILCDKFRTGQAGRKPAADKEKEKRAVI